MAVKKSELYSSLWASCDELRGSMDASQYKDYVLVMLFMKYVSDKKDPMIDLSEGTSFYDMLKFRGKDDIGDKMNTIVGEFAKRNGLNDVIEIDFDDDSKLGSGKDKVDRLTNLLNIFNKPELNFSKNRSEGDDLLGDAYEYLMRHFATESGKSKGQFYTPAEVSRVMAKLIGISKSKKPSDTVYDMTCGSGSLLLKAAEEAPYGITIYGQERDNTTRGLAVMNMWLHGYPDADIKQGNTLTSPEFKEPNGALKKNDYAVSNPPFSDKAWMNGIDPRNDIYQRFDICVSAPPQKNGDYAFLLHMIKSLKSTGKGCIVLPLGVLFRGNAEGEIRKSLITRGYIKGIVGLPPNLFYGTGIAACLIVIDKEEAGKREHIFMIDASKGYIKDGNKNRLRERDIHRIVTTFNSETEIAGYSRKIPLYEISDARNDYNLNIPRYIDNQEEEDIQDIEAHIKGGIPRRDIDALSAYWEVYPQLKNCLYSSIKGRPDYYQPEVLPEDLRNTIFNHPEFTAFGNKMQQVFDGWRNEMTQYAKELDKGIKPKKEIEYMSGRLLEAYEDKKLIDKYAVYQHLMDYWNETMQDDLYEITAEGWTAGNKVKRITKTTKKGNNESTRSIPGLEGLEGLLIPVPLIVAEYFAKEQAAIDKIREKLENLAASMQEMLEEQGEEDGLLSNAVDAKGKITDKKLARAIKDIGKRSEDNAEEYDALMQFKKLMDDEAAKKKQLKNALQQLEMLVLKKYPELSVEEIKTLVVEKKWMTVLQQRVQSEMDAISHHLTARLKELSERYRDPMPSIQEEVNQWEEKVKIHLAKMGMEWK